MRLFLLLKNLCTLEPHFKGYEYIRRNLATNGTVQRSGIANTMMRQALVELEPMIDRATAQSGSAFQIIFLPRHNC